MNRNDEFTELMKELDGGVPEVGESIKRGSRRKARKQLLYQPLMSLAALFAVFILAVNLCAPVAMAFSNVPLLKELTKSVIFSKSLRDAIENEYVQGVDLKQTKNGVTVEIVSMVVDQDRLTVFYRFESEKYKHLIANGMVFDEYGEDQFGMTECEMSSYDCPNEEIRSVSTSQLLINMTDRVVMDSTPEKVVFRMVVWDRLVYDNTNYLPDEVVQEGSEHIMTFDFLLDLNPENMPQPITYEVNQVVELEGQKLTVQDIVVYPTFMRVTVEEASENTASLSELHFYAENEEGERFYNFLETSKIIPIDEKEPVLFEFNAESPYFSDSESLKLVIIGAEWMEPGKEQTYVNLTTGEVKNLPDYVTLKETMERYGKLYLKFSQQCVALNDDRTGESIGRMLNLNPFTWVYCDGEGNKHSATRDGFSPKEELDWNVTLYGGFEYDEDYNITDVYNCTFCLEDYPYEEIFLENYYSKAWRGEYSIVIK